MTCRDHAEPIEDCCGCAGRWDSAMAERAIVEYRLHGIAAATIRAAIAELDAHAIAVSGEHADGTPCLECGVRSLRRQIVAERLAHEMTERMRAAAHDAGVALTLQREADIAEATATYEAMRAELEALRCHDLDAFHDNELDEARTAAFRLHLGTCDRCADELEGRMQETAINGGCNG